MQQRIAWGALEAVPRKISRVIGANARDHAPSRSRCSEPSQSAWLDQLPSKSRPVAVSRANFFGWRQTNNVAGIAPMLHPFLTKVHIRSPSEEGVAEFTMLPPPDEEFEISNLKLKEGLLFCDFYAFRGCSAMSPLCDVCQFSPIVSQETAIDWRGTFVRFERLALAKPAGQHHQNTRFVFTINFYGN
jgi:hypothetical protein